MRIAKPNESEKSEEIDVNIEELEDILAPLTPSIPIPPPLQRW